MSNKSPLINLSSCRLYFRIICDAQCEAELMMMDEVGCMLLYHDSSGPYNWSTRVARHQVMMLVIQSIQHPSHCTSSSTQHTTVPARPPGRQMYLLVHLASNCTSTSTQHTTLPARPPSIEMYQFVHPASISLYQLVHPACNCTRSSTQRPTLPARPPRNQL